MFPSFVPPKLKENSKINYKASTKNICENKETKKTKRKAWE
jgi:hypothetical protein